MKGQEMSATIHKFSADDWYLLKMLHECQRHYKTLPYSEREKFKITERKEKLMFKGIVSDSVVEVAA